MDEEYQRILFGTTEDDFVQQQRAHNISANMSKEGINLLLDWYNKQPHLPKNGLEEKVLARFYAGCNHSVEKAKVKIENYFTFRSLFSEFYRNRDPFSTPFLNTLKQIQWTIIPQLTPEKYRVTIFQYKKCDMNLFNLLECYKHAMMVADLRMRYDVCLGDLYVIDYSNYSLQHVLKTPPSVLKKAIHIIQNSYVHKIKGIHLLNLPNVAITLDKLRKSFMKKKIIDRIHYHSSSEELHKFIPSKILPAEYGGQNVSCDEIFDPYLKAMRSDIWRQWYLDSEHIKSDESKRFVNSGDKMAETLGIMGSFRKLDID